MSKRRGASDHRTRVGKERGARTETRILEAALGVFAARGPDAPVIDEFVRAAGIARGTFYNHFRSVEDLLRATSEWTTREKIRAIEDAMVGLDAAARRGDAPLLRERDRDPVWSQFVSRAWKLGGIELPVRDVEAGMRLGHFRVPSREVAQDVVFGATREALLRIGSGQVPRGYGDQVAEMCLHALRADPRRIAAALAHELPPEPSSRIESERPARRRAAARAR